MRNEHLRPEGRASIAGVAGACALLLAAACTGSATSPVGSVRQADLSDASVAPTNHEYAVFTSVAGDPRPGARAQTSLAYDPARGVSILYGGNDINGPLSDTWEFDGKWKPVNAGGSDAPGARGNAAMAFAAGRGVAVLFGGFRSPGALCETWEWNGVASTWRLASDPACTDGEGVTARRMSHAMADFGDDVALFGGLVSNNGVFTRSNALLRWDGSKWSLLCDAACQAASGGLPAPRSSAAFVHVHQGTRDVLWLFGGTTDAGVVNDTWQFDLATARWSELCTSPACRASAPSVRAASGAAFDAIRGRVVVHGGCTAGQSCTTALGDVYEYDPANDLWAKAPPSFDPAFPDPKSDFGATFDEKRGRVVEFGGYASSSYLDRTLEFYTRGATCAEGAGCDTRTCAKHNANDATGTCAETCSSSADSGPGNFCSGGFRCNAQCSLPCQTCTALPGVCTPITSGPDDDPGDAPGGHCSGVSTCVPSGSSASGNCLLVAGQKCDGDGACASGSCARFGSAVCADTACGDKPCRPATPAGTCTVFGAGHFVAECQGKACGTGGDCLATCSTDDDCDPDYYCDATLTHDCKRGQRYGGACKTSQECGKGVCFDGVCCDEACGGACQACGKDGHCTTLPEGSDPHPGHASCVGAGTGTCGGYCDGVAATCTYPDGKSCGGGACVESDWRSSSICVHGACVAGDEPTSCGAFSCSSGKCNTDCSSNDECRRGAVCDLSSGVGICNEQGTSCSPDGAGVKTESGAVISCDGYLCDSGACAFRPCSHDTDCAAGYGCTSDHRCAEQTVTRDAGGKNAGGSAGVPDGGETPAKARDGGRQSNDSDAGGASSTPSSCSVAVMGRRDASSLSLLGVALGVGLARRRRARRSALPSR